MWRRNDRATTLFVGLVVIGIVGCDGSNDEEEHSMGERAGLVTMKGNPITLVGKEVKVGQKAPDVGLVANDLSLVTVKRLSASPTVCLSRTSACRRGPYL